MCDIVLYPQRNRIYLRFSRCLTTVSAAHKVQIILLHKRNLHQSYLVLNVKIILPFAVEERYTYVYVSDHILYAVIINCSYSAKQYLVWSQLSKSRLQFFSFSVHKTQKSNIFQKQALKNVFFAECATKYQTFVQ